MVSPLEPQQISTEEVPDFISAYLIRPSANPPKCSSRERPRTRGNQQYRPSRQSLPLPRYNRQINSSDTCPHFNRVRQEQSSYQPRYSDETGITCIHHLKTNICITKIDILTTIMVMSNVMHPTCLL